MDHNFMSHQEAANEDDKDIASNMQPVQVDEPVKPDTQSVIRDAVWGRLDETSPKYRNLSWIRATVVELKTQIGLGVLGLPVVFNILGYVPAIIIILGIAVITGWTNFVIGDFKKRHPEVHSVPDVGGMIGGTVGRAVMGFALWLLNAAIAGVGLLGTTVAFNTLTEHATCTIVWYVVAAVIVSAVASIQTLDRISWVSWVGLTSVMAGLFTLLIAVGVQSRPSAAPPTGPWHKHEEAVASPTFIDTLNAISIIVFAYCGTPNYLSIVGEMRYPGHYARTVWVSQTFLTVVYIVFGGLVYHFVGQYIASPALGSAGPLLKRVCYGLALPGLLAGCILYTHINAKFIFVKLLRNSEHLTRRSIKHYVLWAICIVGNAALALIIAASIPFFGDLVSLVGALPGTLICIQLQTFMWLWDYWKDPMRYEKPLRWKLLVAMNVTFHLIGWFALVTGTYVATVTINEDMKSGSVGKPWSCADNS